MRIIIIIQAIIIALGAYYFYVQSQAVKVVPVVVPPEVVVPTTREGYVPPTMNPPTDVTIEASTSASGVTGHSDVGMEYPVMDATLEVR